ncbi:hypothetical protein VPH49_21765 [Pseudomonas luteola]|uniref:hypothetical protein n=1 Tax=Pseudomonas luteola TaxID=47886 RepID=UPI003A8742A2
MNYIQLAMRTNSNLTGCFGIPADLLHATLGLVDEHFEYQAADSWLNAVEELGDMCWFVALAANALPSRANPFEGYETFLALNPDAPLLADAIAEIVDQVKRAYAYGKPLVEIKERLEFLLCVIVARISVIAEQKCKRELHELLSANISKLSARYPEKFDQGMALVRTIKNESSAMRATLQ